MADEEHDSFDKIQPPPPEKLGAKLKPIIEVEQMKLLIKDAEKGKGSEDRVYDRIDVMRGVGRSTPPPTR